jgi:hypothetical protein
MYIELLRSGRARNRAIVSGACLGLVCGLARNASAVLYTSQIGLNQLRADNPSLTFDGTGVPVAMPEGQVGNGTTNVTWSFELNPAVLGDSSTLPTITYSSTYPGSPVTVTSVNNNNPPPNAAGIESAHADTVGQIFFGQDVGLATGITQVQNDDAGYFYDYVIAGTAGASLNARVVNMSYIYSEQDSNLDQQFDNYAAQATNTVFVAPVGAPGYNNNRPVSPGTMYNGISVNVYLGTGTNTTAFGPTANGRSKPDICVYPALPAGTDISYALPIVSASTAILVQAAERGDGGTNAASIAEAQSALTIKALLLNGADKPSDWSHTTTAPLDPRYGAGVLDINNSWINLNAGQYSYSASGSTTASFTPPAGGGTIASLAGWDYNNITTPGSTNQANVYKFNLTSSPQYTLTATLDWDKQNNANAINNLDLVLYNLTTGAVYDESVSVVDNMQYLYDLNLPAGQYDLEVVKLAANEVSTSETYALAFNMTATPEPSTGLLLVGSGAMLLARRRKRL